MPSDLRVLTKIEPSSFIQIALIPLPEPVQLSKFIQPKQLPQYCVDTDEAGLRVYAAGVGQTNSTQRINDLDGALRQATFTTLARDEYGTLLAGILGLNPPSIIIARSGESDIGAGDSGLMHGNRNKSNILPYKLFKHG